MTNDLFELTPLQNVGNHDVPLVYMADRLRKHTLLLPEFQRDYVWEQEGKDKARGWIETVISQQAIGVIVTYQLLGLGDSPMFLADGLQRLTATNKFIDDPAIYGFSFGSEQARVYCEKFMITVQHRHYKNHVEAMRAFQKLNSGTKLLPGEFYKGELTLDEIGTNLYLEIPRIVDTYENSMLERKWVARKKNRAYLLRTTRGDLALFLQYISGTDKMKFWNTMTNMIIGKDIVERQLSEFIQNNNVDIDKLIKNFSEFTASHFAMLRQIMEDTNNKNKPMSITFSRYLFHLNVWRKNTRRSSDSYYRFVTALMKLYVDYDYFVSRIALPNTDPIELIGLKADDLSPLKRLCEYFDLQDFYNGKARPARPSTPGYNVSHKQPFSIFGDGETFLEPAQINKSRGAQPA